MKTFFAYILGCVSIFAGGTNDVKVFTTFNTNTQPGILITLDTFTRAGQTNLLRDVRTKDGVMTIRKHRFYHQGVEVGGYVTYPLWSFSFSVPGAPYSMSFGYDSSNCITSALITSNQFMLEAFGYTNGVFYSEDSAFVEKAAASVSGSLSR